MRIRQLTKAERHSVSMAFGPLTTLARHPLLLPGCRELDGGTSPPPWCHRHKVSGYGPHELGILSSSLDAVIPTVAPLLLPGVTVTNSGLMPTQDRRPLLLPGCRELETVVPLLPWHHRFFRSGGPRCETWCHGISKSRAQGPSKDLSRSRHFPACLGFSFPRPFAR